MDSWVSLGNFLPLFQQPGNLLLHELAFGKQVEDEEELNSRKQKEYLFLSGIVESLLVAQLESYTEHRPRCYALEFLEFQNDQSFPINAIASLVFCSEFFKQRVIIHDTLIAVNITSMTQFYYKD